MPVKKVTSSPVARQPRSPARAPRRSRVASRSPRKSSPKEESPKTKTYKKIDEVKRVASEKSAEVPKLKNTSKQSNVEEISHVYTSSSYSKIQPTDNTTLTRRTTRSVTRALQDEDNVEKDEKAQSCSYGGSCQIASSFSCVFKSLPCLAMSIIGLVMPVIVIYALYLTCKSKKSCTFLAWPTIPDCKKFFNWKSTGFVFGWYLFQLGLSSLPFGKVSEFCN